MKYFKNILFKAGEVGDVYGVNSNNVVYRRTGITTASPMGSGWEVALSYASFVSTGLNNKYVLINGAIFESKGMCIILAK